MTKVTVLIENTRPKDLRGLCAESGLSLYIQQDGIQVVAASRPAVNLYHRLGFREIYQYWYRVKALEP